jgi:YD repeat-containing protein
MTAKLCRFSMIIVVSALCFVASCKKHQRVAASFEFDAAGHLLSATGPDGKKASFSYNSEGLPTDVVSPDGSAHYGYDAHGNRIWVRDDAGATEYYYDAFDRLSAAIWDRGPRRLLAYQYDHAGLPSRISVFNLQPLASDPKFSAEVARIEAPAPSDGSGWHMREQLVLELASQLRAVADGGNAAWLANDISYVRNLQGNLEEIRSAAGNVQFNRSPDGNRVERTLPNGVHSTFEYAAGRRLSRLSHTDPAGHEIASYSYSYGSNGRLQTVSGTEQGRTIQKTDYEWDEPGRLRKIATGGAEFVYQYDEMARRMTVTSGGKSVTYNFDGLGRITSAKGVAMSLSPEGAMNARRDDDETTEIRYNYQNQPLEIATKSGKLRYTWDGEGNLVSLTRYGKTEHFVPAAGTGIQAPFVEFSDEGGAELKQLVGKTVLGRMGAGAARFYLEGATGAAGYVVNEQGLLVGDEGKQARMRGVPGLIPAAFSRRRHVLRDGGRSAEGALVLAQGSYPQQPLPSDPIWRQWHESDSLQTAATQGWWQGLFQMPNAQDYKRAVEFLQPVQDALTNSKESLDRYAAQQWKRGGIIGIGSSVGALTISGPVGIANSITKTTSALDSFFMSPSQKSLLSVGSAGAQMEFDVVMSKAGDMLAGAFAPFLASAIKPAFKSAIDPLAGRYLGVMFKNGDIDKSTYNAITAAFAFANGKSASTAGKTISTSAGDILERWNVVGDLNGKTYGAVTAAYAMAHRLPEQFAEFGIKKGYELAESANNSREHKEFNKPGLGGIELGSAVQGDIGRISGAVYDPATGSIVLLSDNSGAAVSGLKAEDFAIALQLAYSDSPEEAAFSLDPADPKNPRGPWLKKVYYPDGLLAGTDFGKSMFDADWLLKQYSFGVVAELGKPQRERISSVPGFKSVAALSMENDRGANRPATMSRFWIVSGEMKIRREGSAIVFDKASMGVKTKRQVIDPRSKTGLADDNSTRDPIHEEFARLFTEHYDELAAESPDLERVRELAKAVAIAKWLRQNNVPVDMAAMHLDKLGLKNADAQAHYQVSALSTTYQKVQRKAFHEGNREGTLISTTDLYLFGGVDLKSSPEFRSDASVGELQRIVHEKLSQGENPQFQVNYGGRTFEGTVLPLTSEAVLRRANSKSYVRNGNVYRLDSQGRLAEMVDLRGNRTRFRDPAMGVAGGVEVDGVEGWHAVEQETKSGDTLKLTTARGNQIDVVSDSAGTSEEIAVDGKPWAQFHKQASGGSARINQGNYSEVFTLDSAGRTTGYQLERPDGPGKTTAESAKLEFDSEGRPTHLTGTGISETNFRYDKDGQLQEIASSNGSIIEVAHDEASGTTTIEERTGLGGSDTRSEAVASITLENGRQLRGDSPETGRVDFSYNDGRLVAVNSERSGNTSYTYDRYGRPASVDFDSGAEIQFSFKESQDKGLSNANASAYEVQILEPQSRKEKSFQVLPRSYSLAKIRSQS